jgi:metallophosphoesterase superfamily enzyme
MFRLSDCLSKIIGRVWRYQRGNHNTYIEEEHTTQWSKEKVQKDKQLYIKHTHKTKDWATRTPLKPGVNSGAPEG